MRRGVFIPVGRLVILVQALAAVAFVTYLFVNEQVRTPLAGKPYTVKAVFTDASGLRAGGHIPVTVAGVPKGTVEDVRYERGRAVATLRMDGDVRGRVYRDARAEIAPRSALNDLTVDIVPGTPTRGELASGARIPDTRTSGTVGTDRLIGVLDADTRTQVAVLFSQLRGALRGRTDEVAASVRRLPPLVDSSTRVASALAQRRVLLTKLVGETDTLLRTLGDRGRALSSAIAAGDRTLSVTSARAGGAGGGRAGSAGRAVVA